MRSMRYTDYAMRVPLYAWRAGRDARLSPISEISRAYGISQTDLMKRRHTTS